MDRVAASSGKLPCVASPTLVGAFLFPALFSILLWIPAPVAAQDPADRVQEFLESVSGFHLLGNIHREHLGSGESVTISSTLLEGAEYMVVGYCAQGCTNIDLKLLDLSGEEIQADRLPDAEPVLMLTAESSGQYGIQVDAVECSPSGCDIAVGLLGSTAEPGVPPGEDMVGRLNLAGSGFRSLGFTEVGDEMRGSLNMEQTIALPLPLQAGMEYRLAGVCDMDCFDLDLVLLDPEGFRVDADLLDDPFPVLAFVAEVTGEHRLEVSMVVCGLEPCAFRIATYARGENVGPGGTTLSGELVFHETYRGELGQGDEFTPSGTFLDLYEVEARAGQRIIVDLRSEEFDTLLRLTGPEGQLEENDDFGEDVGHSHIELLTLADGVYSVHVTSFDTGMAGVYTLQIAVVE